MTRGRLGSLLIQLGRAGAVVALIWLFLLLLLFLTNNHVPEEPDGLMLLAIISGILSFVGERVQNKADGEAEELNACDQQFTQLYQAGKYKEAMNTAERAVALADRQFGSDHPAVGTRINNLALLYREQARYAEAEARFNRALEIAEKGLGPDHQTVSTILSNLAVLYQALGRHAEAEAHFERALAIAENAHGPNHPDVGRDLNNLAQLYLAKSRHAEAEPLLKRALAIGEKTLGPDHPMVGTVLNNLAVLCREQARYAEAEPLCKRALAIDEKALGPDHPGLGIDLNNLANIALLHRRLPPRYASRTMPRPSRSSARSRSRGRSRLIRVLAVLAGCTEQLICALAMLAIDRRRSPNRVSASNLVCLPRSGRYAEAAAPRSRRRRSPDHADRRDLHNIAELYRAQARYAEAEPLFKRALAIARRRSTRPPTASTALNNLPCCTAPRLAMPRPSAPQARTRDR